MATELSNGTRRNCKMKERKPTDKIIADGPSLALSISYANGGFYYTGFYSYQDTVCLLNHLISHIPTQTRSI